MANATYDTTSSASTSGAQASLTWSHTCTGSDLVLVVGVSMRLGTNAVTGITYNGVAMTYLQEQINTSDFIVVQYYLSSPATGANNVVVSLSPSRQIIAGAVSISSANTASPIGSVVTANGASGTLSSVTSGSLVVTTISNNFDDAGTPNTGTERWTITTASPNSLGGQGSTTTSTDVGWSGLTAGASAALAAVEIYMKPIVNYPITIAQGAYTYTGYSTAFSYGRKIVLAFGSYVYTGFSVILTLFQKWIKQAMNSSSISNQSKNSSTWTNQSDNSSTFDNQTKN